MQQSLILPLGAVCVTLTDGLTVTRFPDGLEVHAAHDDVRHLGQDATAQALGYADVRAMNVEHDLCHSLLAAWLGLPHSPTLRGVATGESSPFTGVEEAAVLAVQRFAVTQGVDLVQVAQRGYSCRTT